MAKARNCAAKDRVVPKVSKKAQRHMKEFSVKLKPRALAQVGNIYHDAARYIFSTAEDFKRCVAQCESGDVDREVAMWQEISKAFSLYKKLCTVPLNQRTRIVQSIMVLARASTAEAFKVALDSLNTSRPRGVLRHVVYCVIEGSLIDDEMLARVVMRLGRNISTGKEYVADLKRLKSRKDLRNYSHYMVAAYLGDDE